MSKPPWQSNLIMLNVYSCVRLRYANRTYGAAQIWQVSKGFNKVLTAVLIILMLIALFFFFNDSSDNNSYEEISVPKEVEKYEDVNKLEKEIKKAKELGQVKKVEKTEQELLTKLPKSIQKAFELAKAANFSINFYGKVIDQNNLPVINAKVEYSTMGLWNLTNGSRGFVTTDQDGLFNVRADGNKLFISMPKHPEIVDAYIPSLNEKAFPKPRKQIQLEAGKEVSNGSEGWDNYSSDSPYIVRSWRVDSFEKVFYKRKNLFLKPDASIHTLVQKDKYGKMILNEGSDPEGILNFTCVRDESAYAQRNGSWQATIEAVDGGIQETQDIILNKAPIDGYQSSISVSMDGGGVYGSSVLKNKKYYFSAHNSHYYGSIAITFEPFWKKSCIINVEYKINPNGSRNLAVKSEAGY